MTKPSADHLSDIDRAVVIALGSNLSGDYASPVELLEAALARFPAEGIRIVQRSSWWRSAAWPNPADPPFVNGVVIVETEQGAAETLAALHRIEAAFGRRRHERNAPRTLDLDLIAFGRARSAEPALPHPRAHERAFVMRPLAEIAPAWRHPVTGASATELAPDAKVGADACKLTRDA